MKNNILRLALTMGFAFNWNLMYAQDNFEMAVIKKGSTRVSIAENLLLDVSGEYQNGYYPRWENISRRGNFGLMMGLAKPDVEDLSAKNPKKKTWVTIHYQLAQKDNKAVFIANDYYADIDTKGSVVILNSSPQTFQLTNFRLIKRNKLTDEPLESSVDKTVAGGANGNIALSANNNGDVSISFMIQFSRTASRFTPAGLSYRYTLNNGVSKNNNTVENSIASAKREKERDAADAALKEAHAKQDAALALKVKNSYLDIAKLQSTYPSSNACLKSFAGKKNEKYIDHYVSHEGLSMSEYDFNTGGLQFKTEYTPVYKTRMVPYTGQKNVCNKTVIIKGIVKLTTYESEVYYEDRSIKLKPGEVTENEIILEKAFDPEKTAEVGIRHYYINNLPVKKPMSKANINLAKRVSDRKLEVDSYTNMTDIVLQVGDKMKIQADGFIRVAPLNLVPPVGPAGIKNYDGQKHDKLFPFGALIAKIGDKGEWFLIGYGRAFNADTSGKLMLKINDDEPDDNNWHYDVDYNITLKSQ